MGCACELFERWSIAKLVDARLRRDRIESVGIEIAARDT